MRNSQKTPPIMLESTAYNNTDIVNILQIGSLVKQKFAACLFF